MVAALLFLLLSVTLLLIEVASFVLGPILFVYASYGEYRALQVNWRDERELMRRWRCCAFVMMISMANMYVIEIVRYLAFGR